MNKPFFIQNIEVLSENEKTFVFEADFYFEMDGTERVVRGKTSEWPIEQKEYILRQSAQNPRNTTRP